MTIKSINEQELWILEAQVRLLKTKIAYERDCKTIKIYSDEMNPHLEKMVFNMLE